MLPSCGYFRKAVVPMLDRITLGDFLKKMRLIPSGSVDMILTDLPYGTTACRWDSVIPFEPLWKEYERVIKPDGAVVLFAAQPFTTKLIESNFRRFRYCWYWLKPYATGFTFAKYQPMRRVEDICVFYKRTPKYHPQGLRELERPVVRRKRETADSVYKSGTLSKKHEQRYTGYPKNVLEFPSDVPGGHGRLHPTQKPAALCEYLIRTYTNPGDIVLDSCCGSGTTAAACVRTFRHYIGIEMDAVYHARAVERVEREAADKREQVETMFRTAAEIAEMLKGNFNGTGICKAVL